MAGGVNVGNLVPDLVYRTVDGGEKHLADLWANSPALIVWLRHFG